MKNTNLVDAFCSALHPVIRNFPEDSDKGLVIDTGNIRINVVSSLRTLESKARNYIFSKI